jgi:hypothetical protein
VLRPMKPSPSLGRRRGDERHSLPCGIPAAGGAAHPPVRNLPLP